MQAGLHDSAVIAHRFDASVERRFEARTFDRSIDAYALLGILADIFDDIDRFRIEHRGLDAEALDMLPAIGVGFADEDLRGADGVADQNDKRADRPGARDSTVLPPVTFERSTL